MEACRGDITQRSVRLFRYDLQICEASISFPKAKMGTGNWVYMDIQASCPSPAYLPDCVPALHICRHFNRFSFRCKMSRTRSVPNHMFRCRRMRTKTRKRNY